MLCDILHHHPHPEDLVIASLGGLADRGSLMIMDHNCESWEDSYYLELLHLVYAKTTGPGNYLPTYGYRRRSYWREFMRVRGYGVVYEEQCQTYGGYVDVYQKGSR